MIYHVIKWYAVASGHLAQVLDVLGIPVVSGMMRVALLGAVLWPCRTVVLR